jgi:predicted nucleic acid-binding protein
VDRTLLDTDILSEVLKAKNANVVERVTAYKAAFEQLTISAITVMEIVTGLHDATCGLAPKIPGQSQSKSGADI